MSEQGKQTEGPWIVFVCDGISTILPAGRSSEVATGIKNSQDAHLMAAAPDMLAALKLVRAHVSPAMQPIIYSVIDAALAKAESRT